MLAVKILDAKHCDPEQLDAAEQEIKMHQKLLHQNIAQIYQVVRKDEKIYLFMEYCSNGELFSSIVDNGPLPEKEAARLFHQILSALLYLRKMGISHRDIKLENLLLDKDWNIKLVDFGFSC